MHGTELWITDGTAAGTQLALDVEPGANGSNPSQLTAFGSQGVVFSATTAAAGEEPWFSDNGITSPSNTRILGSPAAGIFPGAGGSSPRDFVFSPTAFGSSSPGVIFSADNGTNGREPFGSNVLVTLILKDILPGLIHHSLPVLKHFRPQGLFIVLTTAPTAPSFGRVPGREVQQPC